MGVMQQASSWCTLATAIAALYKFPFALHSNSSANRPFKDFRPTGAKWGCGRDLPLTLPIRPMTSRF
ncbi:hypothetical protein TNCV_428491 [Trichonephila clavipes]|nr:hypothetical protein TNCV_428491 [Trichonephila clavipes]